ncbi:WecB/TagA/CpsF family glycosyltransferase [Azospirillum soli]|uniref:WecB/TagA/CpsF family glycosyltransferase n=1 Tax=Azospirillum soli TaxID=1304799 RepID=UPI001AE8FC79|nr:WecB/TagA/CpsF family glycosyltransferase [Azospirillum soli]MBP2312548.1 exopolysaccharide biosynthesis WecB/TagA/CpsF family protein [Azospirillum soli]
MITHSADVEKNFEQYPRKRLCSVPFDSLPNDDVLSAIRERDAGLPFQYVVTPNADHVVRLNERDAPYRAIYEEAWISLCDSWYLNLFARMSDLDLTYFPGSNLVAELFGSVLAPGNTISVIGGGPRMIERLRARYPHVTINVHVPPMGFIGNPDAVARCVDFVAEHPARFVFLAVGSPQQEILAYRIRRSGRATGLGFCVGASLLFLTGLQARAPIWMQRRGLEWVHRLAKDPGRMWKRYLVTDLQIVWLFARWYLSPARTEALLMPSRGRVPKRPA